MTHDEMIAVIQADKEGKKLEFRRKKAGNLESWDTVQSPVWDFNAYDYRVKKEPMVLWVNIYLDGSYNSYRDENTAKQLVVKSSGVRTVKLVEVPS